MKKIVALVAVLTFVGSVSAMAAMEDMAGTPEVLYFKPTMGNITFTHRKHQQSVKGECKTCHEKKPGKIEGFGKEWAHKKCWDCHAEKKIGQDVTPKCKFCHQKKAE